MVLAVILVLLGVVLARFVPGLSGWAESATVIGVTAVCLVWLLASGQIA